MKGEKEPTLSNEQSDRELLDLAAKAAGMTHRMEGSICVRDPLMPSGFRIWNPLTDDGDALRLAADLRISITMSEYGRVVCRSGEWARSIEPYGDDARAATRRAIVRAAAEIGRTQEAAHGVGGTDGR